MKFLTLLFIISKIYALPDGAPQLACHNLLPIHGRDNPIGRQTDASPYTIKATFNRGKVLVTIFSSLGVPFQGFMLQARAPDQETRGMFESYSNDAKTVDCIVPTDTLTHSSPKEKKRIDVEWDPLDYRGPIVFNATVAQDFSRFWTSNLSPRLEVTDTNLNAVGTFPPGQGQVQTTPPNFKPDPKKESSTEFDPFYDGCDVTKSCFGTPPGCVNSKNCKGVMAVTVKGNKYEFEVKATNNPGWVGIGLSDDTFMGDDSVVECVKEGNTVSAYMSATRPRPNLGVQRLSKPKEGIQLLSSSQADGALYCKISRDEMTNVNGRVYDLASEKYYILVASGSSVESRGVTFHNLGTAVSGEKRALSEVSSVKSASKLLLRLHGAFMLAAWIGTASIGILLARYYRQTWVGSMMCGKDQWFAWHRFFMVVTWTLTMAGFILIFVELKAWSAEKNPHAILGTVVTILCFLQPIGAYFRPHPGTSKRPIFNWLHWFIGNAAHIIAIVTIFFAVKLNKAELPEWFDWVMVAYVAFHVIMHLILSIMGCAAEKSLDRRVTSFPMKDLGGTGRTSSYADRNTDAPFTGLRRFLLGVYIIVILVLVVALIFVIVVAPVEDFWATMKDSISNN